MTLQEYLDRENITIYKFAKKYRLPQRQVYKYATGQAIPRPDIMNIIRYATGNNVQANDFYKNDGILFLYHLIEKKDKNMIDDINLDEEITIICKRHGEFKMKAKDHIGENDEKVAYGCPNCKCDVQLDN